MAEKNYTLQELSEITQSELIGKKDHCISSVNTLDVANEHEASFLANPRYEEAMRKSKAGVVCVFPEATLEEGKNYLISKDPSRTFQKIAEITLAIKPKIGFTGIHPTAVIHKTAKIGKDVTIGPYSVIDQDAVIGDNTFISAQVFIGSFVKIGKDCVIHASVTVREGSILGDRIILQPGAVIGSCGFGYTPDKFGNHKKLEQIGNVIIEDDVEIGANSTIDRARFKTTIIRKGTKIDNLVQIAHNVELGEHNIIAAQTGVAGSAKTGKHVMMGGQVGVLGHVELVDQVMLATRAGVSKSLLSSGKYRGTPAIPIHEYSRQKIHIRKLESYVNRLKKLEEKLQALQKNLDKKN